MWTKTTSEKAIFLNTVFSLYSKIRVKNVHAAKTLVFSLPFLFWLDRNQYSNLQKHNRASLEIQFNELNEKLRTILPDQQINWTIPAKKTISKVETKLLKQSKQKIHGKSLKL